MSDGSIATVIS